MNRVVVTGLGLLTPIGNDVNSFWENAVAGRHGFTNITRFDASEIKVKIAGELKGFLSADYMDKNDIRRTDIYSQYAIAAATQAVTDSKIEGNIKPDDFGVYVGSGIGGMNTFVTQTHAMIEKGPSRISPFFIPMMISNMAGALIAIRFSANGPNLPVVSACATGTHAIGEAFRAIKHGFAKAIITGGTEASICPLAIGGFMSAQALSLSSDPDNASIPFDKRRNGFVMGEGSGILILEEYEHAINRGANIYCEVIGYGNTCDAFHMTAPGDDGTQAARMIKQAFSEADERDYDNLYINAHGTSTPLNDKCETLAIKKALGHAAYEASLSSTKSMTGHMLGAAGAVEAITAVLTLKNGIIPPTAGYKEFDPDCDLDYTPNTAKKRNVDKALSLSFGFGGHNAGVLFRKV